MPKPLVYNTIAVVRFEKGMNNQPRNGSWNQSLYARGATAAPMGERQLQIEGMTFSGSGETANQETAPKLAPKTIKNETNMKQTRAKGSPNVAPKEFFSRV